MIRKSSPTTPAALQSGTPLTKIIATIGPASSTPAVLEKLIEAGVSVFRLNFSHGSLAEHRRSLQEIRRLSGERDQHVAVLGDLPGPKIRLGPIPGDGIELKTGDTVIFQRGVSPSAPSTSPYRLCCTYDRLIDDVNPGERVLINDGAIRMLAIQKGADEVECTVTVGGMISTGKGINLPETTLRAPALTERDLECVEWAVENDIDYLALSFVRIAQDIADLRGQIESSEARHGKSGSGLPVIAKIELPAAVSNIDAILDVSDGIMIARGDLGVEMELARVPVIQKQLIEAARQHGRLCIVATQMLESMMHSPTPTRAEASDVANAVFECVDAVMLSGETAIGRFPLLAIEHMEMIARHTEAYLASLPQAAQPPARPRQARRRTAALAHGVWTVAIDLGARTIVVWSQKGGGARLLSQNDVCIPILAMSSDERAVRRMRLMRGVTPVHAPVPPDLIAFTQLAERILRERGWATDGDRCILVAGSPIGQPGATNSLAILEVGDPTSGFGAG